MVRIGRWQVYVAFLAGAILVACAIQVDDQVLRVGMSVLAGMIVSFLAHHERRGRVNR